MDFVIVIPARSASSRFPGKPLIDLNGKSLLQRTYEQCIKAVPKEKVFVATDSEDIQYHCFDLDIQVVMTSEKCLTGTDRVADFAKKVKADIYINVQGDEPLMNPEDIRKIIAAIKEFPGEIINGYTSIDDEEQYRSMTIPKVVFRPDGRLLYMSRSPIPGNKENEFKKSWRQVCIYAFPKISLFDFSQNREKTNLEEQEDIEIIRFLEMGCDVRMVRLSKNSIAVDTPQDADKVRQILTELER